MGKQDNCQVGFFGALGRADRVSLIDARLYLPEDWTKDQRRGDEADIPEVHRVHKTKIELALEIVLHARRSGVRFEWVGIDGGYGQSFSLLQTLEDRGEIFVAHIHADRHIYLDDPAPCLPVHRSGLGRKPLNYKSEAHAIEVRKWVKSQPASAWRKKILRGTTKGRLIIEILHRRVWLWDKRSSTTRCLHLVVRREVNSPATIKYSLSNAAPETSVVKLAKMQAQRFWIERAFQDAKSHVGMAQYQARQWQSWHRHMALGMMAMQFMLESRINASETHPLLSCYDIQILIAKTMPDRRRDADEVIRQLHERHQKRQASIDSAATAHA